MFFLKIHPLMRKKVLFDCTFIIIKRNIWNIFWKLISFNRHYNIYNTLYIMLINLHIVINGMQYVCNNFLDIMIYSAMSNLIYFYGEFSNCINIIIKVIIDNLIVINIFTYTPILVDRSRVSMNLFFPRIEIE